MGLFGQMQNSRNASELLSSTQKTLMGGAFWGQAPPGCHKAAPRPDRLRTADSETLTLTKYVVCTSSGAVADRRIPEYTTRQPSSGQARAGFFQNIQPRPPGRYLSPVVRGPQTAPLTGPVEIPLTRQETWAPVQKLLPGGSRRPLFEHGRHLL